MRYLFWYQRSAHCWTGLFIQSLLILFFLAPAILPLFYNMVKPFLAEYTRSKVRVLGSKRFVIVYCILNLNLSRPTAWLPAS